ncbi:flavin reductase family protein [Microbacterium marinilacus]|uniref:Flavin reductase family protein n=1 Tax=Microbacterium marinilacus TaxID=415209 RepID=A0ABP7BMD3_9MICO|nr:flavin reductase family protein [Microbacterium marinilacus]MBY0690444.1 flavin reductase family protein [Microbacterium marinilacus]
MSTLVEDFKAAFRGHPAGVALITAQTADGPVGLTASSVASVSVDPPALSFSVTKTEGSAGGVLAAPSFLVHLLGESHAPVAEAFARSGSPRFTPEQGWAALSSGEPHLTDAPVALRARALSVVPSGSSRLVLAEVIGVHHGPTSPPLIYQNRRFLSLLQTSHA